MNGSGRAPAAATLEAYRSKRLAQVPYHVMLAVTVPGAVHAWATVLERFGTRRLADVLAPAVAYAEEGFPVSEIVAHEWALMVGAGFLQRRESLRAFTADGEPPRPGVMSEVQR